jgi:tetratricopeptide (TPR) repeat protein
MRLGRLGPSESAARLLRRAVRARPGDLWLQHALGKAAADLRPPRYEEAVRHMAVVVAMRPDSPGAHYNLGLLLAQKGEVTEAVFSYRKALELAPRYAQAHADLGTALSALGRHDEAVAACRRAVELAPQRALFRCHLGRALNRPGKQAEALACVRQAIGVDPSSTRAYFDLGVFLLRTGKHTEAAAACRRAVLLAPMDAQAQTNLGVALAGQGKLSDAVACYRAALRVNPKLPQAHLNLGIALAEQNNYQGAERAFRQLLALTPKNAQAHYGLGDALLGQGRAAEAVACYQTAITLAPDYAEGHCNLGQAFQRLGRFADSLAAYRRGHALGMNTPGWRHDTAAWVREAERMASAEALLPAFQAGAYRPRDSGEQLRLAAVCVPKGLRLTAAKLYAEAFADHPGLADSSGGINRGNAARNAALAAAGRGADAGPLDAASRARWRRQALTWLRADLALQRRRLKSFWPAQARQARHALRAHQSDPDLASLREPAALARLPAEERQACRSLWADVTAALAGH